MPRVGEESQQVCVADALGGGIHQRMETEQLVLANGIVEQHLDPVLRIVRCYLDPKGHVYEISVSHHPGDRFAYAMHIDLDS